MRLLKISIIVIVGISLAIFGIFYTQEIEQNIQLSTDKDLPEDKELTVQKTWIELEPINCYGNLCNVGWLSSYYNSSNLQTEPYLGNLQGVDFEHTTEFIKDYYKKQGIVVFDVRYSWIYQEEMCEVGECWLDYKLEILVSNSDVKQMLDLGFKVSEPIIQKTWVEIESVQCDNRFGHSSFESFFEKQVITIFDSKREERFKGNPYCEGCGCSSGYTLLFLVSDSDVEKMLEMGFTKSQ